MAYIRDSCDFNILKKVWFLFTVPSVFIKTVCLYIKHELKRTKNILANVVPFDGRARSNQYKFSSLSNKFQTSVLGYKEESNNTKNYILNKGSINVHWSLKQCFSHQNVHYDELKLVLRSRQKFHAKIKSIKKYLRVVKYSGRIDI